MQALYEFQMHFSRTNHLCYIDYYGIFLCYVMVESDPNNYFTYDFKINYPNRYFSISMSPNEKDIWLSGGINLGIQKHRYTPGQAGAVSIEKRIALIKNNKFTYHSGPALPKPLIGHCIVSIGSFRMFLFGGLTTMHGSSNATNLVQSQDAWIWHGNAQVCCLV